MKYLILPFAAILYLGAGCAEATQPLEDDRITNNDSQEDTLVEDEEEFDLQDVEAMTVADEDLDVDKNFELSKHTIYFASSPDAVTWTLREDPIAKYASVPDLVVLKEDFGPFPQGTLLAYFVDGTQKHDQEDVELGLVYSLDGGKTWSDRLYTTMVGMPDNTIAVDPGLVLLDDGRLRLYYFDFPEGIPGKSSQYQFHTAISENGIDFTYEGVVFSTDQLVTDPDVIEFDNLWRMYFMGQDAKSMMVSVSEDPLSFSSQEQVNNIGIPGVIVVDDEVWLFSCGANGITRLTSQDGVTFVEVDDSVVSVSSGVHCDPSPAELVDGTYGMVFKYQDLKPVRP